MSALLKLDVFRKLPKDLTEPTFCGAIVSTICTVVLVLLSITEIRTYLSPATASMIAIQSSHDSDKFHINMDIVMPFMPCDVVALTVEDQMQNRVSDYYGELHKHRLTKDGEEISVETWEEKNQNRQVVADRIEQELKDGQGCRLSGFIDAVRVPGNFYISHSGFGDIKMWLSQKGYHLNNSFTINHLSFGKKEDFNEIAIRYPDAGVMHPLDGYERLLPEDQVAMRVGFYIKAVPAIFLGEFSTWFLKIFDNRRLMHHNEVFQLTASSETEFQSYESLIIFNYEVSPFAIQYTNARENFLQFLINMCAIIGGVFTFASIVDSLIHKGSKMVFKDRINKLQ